MTLRCCGFCVSQRYTLTPPPLLAEWTHSKLRCLLGERHFSAAAEKLDAAQNRRTMVTLARFREAKAICLMRTATVRWFGRLFNDDASIFSMHYSLSPKYSSTSFRNTNRRFCVNKRSAFRNSFRLRENSFA